MKALSEYLCNLSSVVECSLRSTQSAQLAAEPVSTSVETISMVKVKDEPVDEEYDQALAPAVLSEGVKDEPDAAEVRHL